jgi:hypothetical protein
VRWIAAPLLLALSLAACGRDGERQDRNASPAPRKAARAAAPANQAGVTPMAQRVAVLGVLNKRNGIVRNVVMRPGQSARWKDMVVHLRACETSAPWEEEKLTGAFVQIDVQRPDDAVQRVFSGWLYKESPSLNVVEHPVYDVWPKSCAMTYPAGPSVPAAPVTSSNRSSAAKSGAASGNRPRPPARTAAPPAEPGAPPVASAADSNAT